MIGIGAIVGLALFYGDGVLTPAVTMMSAIEGLQRGERRVRSAGGAAVADAADRPVRVAKPAVRTGWA